MTAALRILATVALFPRGYFVQWTLDGATDPGVYRFDVYRSGGPDGPWEAIATGLDNSYAFVDEFVAPIPSTTLEARRPNQLNLFREFVYRVVCTTPSGTKLEAIDDVGASYDGQLNDRVMARFVRKGQRDFRLTLKFNGTPCAFLKRRRWGERCVCVDKRTREVIRASCVKCWGTGIVGGYWAPHLSSARRNVGTSASAVTPQQKSDANDIKLWMPDYPQVEQDDLVVFFKDQRRFRLDQSAQTEIRLRPVHQVVSAQEIDHGDLIYRLPVLKDRVAPLF